MHSEMPIQQLVRRTDTELLGLGAELALLTQGTAKHWIALSHYALVTGDPGDDAA